MNTAKKLFKITRLTADDCEALARSPEGSSSLTQPLSQRRSRGDVNRGLHPTHRPPRGRLAGNPLKGQGQQKSIMDFFGVSQTRQVSASWKKSSKIKEELLDPIFKEPTDSFSKVSTAVETSCDSCSFLEDEDFVPAPRKKPRKPPLSTASAAVHKLEQDLWGELEKKPVVVHPEHSQIKEEVDDMDIEPVPDAHYGLLGTRNWEVPQGSIEELPVEVLRNIFAFLPVTDLYQNLSLVCRCWREIISDPLFIPWKKLYHRYLMKEDTALRGVEQILQDFAIKKEQEECVLGLIRCVSALPTSQKVDPSEVLQCLKSHHLFSKAEICVANKLPHLQSRTRLETLWAIIAAMVLFSDGVSDIQKLMVCLLRPCSTLTVVDVTETLYCMATLLCAMRNRDIPITNRIHYNIFYCLYLMENASVTVETVKEETGASHCGQDLWSSYKDKGKLNFSKMSVLSISFLLQNREGQSLYIRGKTVSQTLETFFASSDEEICEEHTPVWFKSTHGEKKLVTAQEKKINVQEAKEIWHNMKKLDGDVEKKYKITCDGYLKLWQLSKPQLSGYDVIFVDEAQDCTPAIVDVVLSQKCGIILVGDPHQQIYTFRGAVNTLYSVPHTHIYYLTQSFRFGPEIAYVGATILDVCKRIRSKTLVGGNQKGDVRGLMEGKRASLSRSNFNVFEDAVKLTGRERPVKIHVIGGLERFGLSRIHDIWKLSQPAEERRKANLVINDSFIKRWEETQGFLGLKEYVERVDDKDLEGKIAIVEKYKDRVPELVQKIKSSHVSQEALADYLIGTVHQAKGLEFDTVLIAEDFVKVPSLSADYQRRIKFHVGLYPEDEWNLLYVAVTRAKKYLLMSKSLEDLLALAGERFLRVELMSQAGKDGATTCSAPQCGKPLPPSSRLVVKKLPLTHSNDSRDEGGYLCHSCTQQRFGSLAPLTSFPEPQEQPLQL
ncbi:F-box DNA helicase 1 isoform X4 [Apus apus]|uniref:F-box DNA helicase 1 isoform X4 n=1 Tax=Apus apus TaxID=8895 RepID=UPI0021F84A23|nr:F-box DNA helicase 1 isoform X4 [Apus apus]